MMPLRPGSVFAGAYEIVRPISAGGMGIVYEVVHVPTQRSRALKVMLANIVSDPEMRARFSLEAIVSAGIDSEHITQILDAGIDSETDCPYLVMELLRGEDLAGRLKRAERFSAAETMLLMSQVALALEKTHAKGVVHRDLKPDNLFMTHHDDGSPCIKILDFGIAKVIKQDFTGPQATTKTFGTPYYMAREQITGESKLIGPASDLYSIAQIVFTMLVGTAYFQEEAKESGGNILTVLMAVGRGATEPATSRALRLGGVVLPPSFDPWFAKATAVLPRDRFASSVQMIDALRLILAEPVRVLSHAERPPHDPAAARASSERIEESFSISDRLSVIHPGTGPNAVPMATLLGAGHETGGPQSLSLPKIGAEKKRSSLLFLAGLVVMGAAISVAVVHFSRGAATAPAQAHDAASQHAASQDDASKDGARDAESSAPRADTSKTSDAMSPSLLGALPDSAASASASPSNAPDNALGLPPGKSKPSFNDPRRPYAASPSNPQPKPATPTKTSKGPFENTL